MIGLVFTLTGYAIDGYLSLLWLTGMSYLSNRPLLILGTFLIMVGIQLGYSYTLSFLCHRMSGNRGYAFGAVLVVQSV